MCYGVKCTILQRLQKTLRKFINNALWIQQDAHIYTAEDVPQEDIAAFETGHHPGPELDPAAGPFQLQFSQWVSSPWNKRTTEVLLVGFKNMIKEEKCELEPRGDEWITTLIQDKLRTLFTIWRRAQPKLHESLADAMKRKELDEANRGRLCRKATRVRSVCYCSVIARRKLTAI